MDKTNSIEVKNFIRIIIVVVVTFFVFYLITALSTGRKKGDYTKPSTTPSIIQYDEILLGELYHQKETNYFVLVEEKDDSYISLFENLLTQASKKENGIPYYKVNLSSVLNQKFIGETADFTENLKVAGTTLFRIQNGIMVAHYETSETILEFLKTL